MRIRRGFGDREEAEAQREVSRLTPGPPPPEWSATPPILPALARPPLSALFSLSSFSLHREIFSRNEGDARHRHRRLALPRLQNKTATVLFRAQSLLALSNFHRLRSAYGVARGNYIKHT